MMANKDIIINYLFKQGLTECAVFGLLGNIQAESAFIPNNLQDSYERKLGFTNETYTAAVDSGAYKNFDKDKAGYGTCQWTSDGRKAGLLDLARSRGISIGDLNMQLDYLMIELRGAYRGVLNGIMQARTIRAASDIVLTQFEKPADQSESAKRYRAGLGEKLYNEWKGGSTNPYKEPTQNVAMARDEVRWIQYQLNSKGYHLTVDGIWGNQTEAMVRAFQADNGLDIDGIVGPATRAKLEA
jgi:peptidoglycan hydrolase-like protein with peptidoglycan-binding domain